MKIDVDCAWCTCIFQTERGAVNRARKAGLALYCGRTCSGLDRRKNKSSAQRKTEKREYDIIYRSRCKNDLKAKKAAHHRKTYDPALAAKQRQKRMPYHVEYCRRPEQVEKKRRYDRCRNDAVYGPFAECNRLLIDLTTEILSRATREELAVIKGTAAKSQQRKRAYGQLVSGQS